VVVIGAHAELMKKELECLPVSIAENSEWNSGISSSIRLGIQTLAGEVDGAVIMLCDQPFVTVSVVNALVETRRMTGKMIVASAYEEARGVPALFSKELFGEITALKGNEGAKQVIAKHADDVATVCFPEGAVDVDTPQEYETLEKIFTSSTRQHGALVCARPTNS
jgi:molybdenum cofactor cytidylyltransferase